MTPDYQQHPEYLALLESVLADPADDAPRGIIADWIQDHGDDDRAEFIRAQLAAPDSWVEWRITTGGHWVSSGEGDPAVDGMVRDLCVSGWLDGWGAGGLIDFRRGFVEEIRLRLGVFLAPGFAPALFGSQPITTVGLTDRRSLHPTCGVWHSDRELGPVYHGRSDIIPSVLFDRLTGGLFNNAAKTSRIYPVPDMALNDLFAVCVQYGREVAGLPPLG